MFESQKFRQYAQDCIRIADKMNAKDRETLLKIAEAWETRAAEAERKETKKTDGQARGDSSPL